MKKSKLLVVDDDVQNLIVIQSFLEDYHEIILAHNGKEAIEYLEFNDVNLILLDWNMPVMDGMATLKFLKSNLRFKHIQVIMMTGYMTETESLIQAYQNGVIDFIRKPFNEAELLARVNSILKLSEFYRKELEMKSKELVSVTLQLVQYKELITNSMEDLEEILHVVSSDPNDAERKIVTLKHDLQIKASDYIWNQFNIQFQQTNPSFVKSLVHKFPNLTPFETKLCSLLYLNLDTKEIASILFQTYDSIRVSRTRLRKKLGVNASENLYGFLIRI